MEHDCTSWTRCFLGHVRAMPEDIQNVAYNYQSVCKRYPPRCPCKSLIRARQRLINTNTSPLPGWRPSSLRTKPHKPLNDLRISQRPRYTANIAYHKWMSWAIWAGSKPATWIRTPFGQVISADAGSWVGNATTPSTGCSLALRYSLTQYWKVDIVIVGWLQKRIFGLAQIVATSFDYRAQFTIEPN